MSLTIPNALSLTRIGAVPVLLLLAWLELHVPFLTVFGLAALTDALDGWLARRLNQITELGARLDSIGDTFLYWSLPICAWWLWPDLIIAERWWIALGVGSSVFATAAGYLRYRRMPSHHAWSAKFSTILLPFGCLLLIAGYPVPFRVVMVVQLVASIEDLAMTLLLPRWVTPVRSVFHAVELRRAQVRTHLLSTTPQ